MAITEDKMLDLLFQLAIILLAAKFSGEAFKRLRQPEVLGELAAGIVIGPGVLNLVSDNDIFLFLAELGVIILLFEVGLETDLRTLLRVGKTSVGIAVGGVILPFLLGYWLGLVLGFEDFVSLFLGATFTATSVGVSMRVLSDLGKLDTSEARTVLAVAIYDDIAALLLLTIMVSLHTLGEFRLFDAVSTVIVSMVFLVVSLFFGPRIMPRIIEPVAKMKVRGGLVIFAVSMGIILALLASLAGLSPIIGAFVAGVLVAETKQKGDIVRELAPLVYFIVPIFFVLMGVAVQVGSLIGLLPIGLLFILIASIGKLVGGSIPAYVSRIGKYPALVIGVSMIPRAEVGLIFGRVGLDAGILGQETFGLIILMSIATALVAPTGVRRLYSVIDKSDTDTVESPRLA
jgi:Kef-type K+ transport system membrane component KefB